MTTPATPAATVRVRDLRMTFGRTRALDGVAFELVPGVTGLLGPNGAGKTTLLRVLATVSAPDAGSVDALGLDPRQSDQRLDLRGRLGYMPQEPGFHARFTAFEFVDYVAILKELHQRCARHQEVRRVLELVGLGAVRGKQIKALSGGMRRRVALAQALLGDPDLLVLDEPTAGLDPSSGCASASWSASSGRAAPCCCPPTRPRTWSRSASRSWCCTSASCALRGRRWSWPGWPEGTCGRARSATRAPWPTGAPAPASTVALAAAGSRLAPERRGGVVAAPALLALASAAFLLPAQVTLHAQPGGATWDAAHRRWALLLGLALAAFAVASRDPAHRRLPSRLRGLGHGLARGRDARVEARAEARRSGIP